MGKIGSKIGEAQKGPGNCSNSVIDRVWFKMVAWMTWIMPIRKKNHAKFNLTKMRDESKVDGIEETSMLFFSEVR